MKKIFPALIMLVFASTNYACEKSEQTEKNSVIKGCVGYVRELEYTGNMYQWRVYPIDNQWGRLYKHEKWFAEWDEKARKQMISLIDKKAELSSDFVPKKIDIVSSKNKNKRVEILNREEGRLLLLWFPKKSRIEHILSYVE